MNVGMGQHQLDHCRTTKLVSMSQSGTFCPRFIPRSAPPTGVLMPRQIARIALLWILLGVFFTIPNQTNAQTPDDTGLIDQIDRLITDLNDQQFRVRQAAMLELLRIGDPADSALEKAVSDSPSLEGRTRAAGILKILNRRKMPVAICTLAGSHQNTVTMAVFSVDGKMLASTSEDGNAVLWDWRKSRATSVLKGHVGGVLLAAFSPDNKTLATGGRDAKVILWDVDTGARRIVIDDHQAGVNAVNYSVDGKTFVTGSSDKTIKVRDSDGKLRFTLKGHHQDVIALTLSPDAKLLVSAGGNWNNLTQQGELKVWDLETRTERWSAAGQFGGIWGVALSSDGKQVAGASLDGTVRIWDSESGDVRSILKGHIDRVIWVAYAPGGKLLASASLDGTVRFWDTSYQKSKVVNGLESTSVQRLAFSPLEKVMATAGSDRMVTIWRFPE